MSHPKIDDQRRHAMRAHAQSLDHTLTPFYSATYDDMFGVSHVACCQTCGRRIIDGVGESDALTHACDGDAARAVESRAWLIGQAPRLLVPRLDAGVAILPPDLRRFFDPGHFDAEEQCLDSEDFVWRLQWRPREFPWDEVDDDNPQPPNGVVHLERLVPEAEMRPARYVGLRQNPNISEDPQHWLWQPLEPDTMGVAYHAERRGWCFRRTQGTTGYHVQLDDVEFLAPTSRHATSSAPRSTAPSLAPVSASAEPGWPDDLMAGGTLDPLAPGAWSL